MKFSDIVVIYLGIGILARIIFYIALHISEKKYGARREPPMSFFMELIAHALDVIFWPYATVVSFSTMFSINRAIRKERTESKNGHEGR